MIHVNNKTVFRYFFQKIVSNSLYCIKISVKVLLLYYTFFFFFRTLKHACLFYLLQYFNVLDEGHRLYGDDKTIILSIYSVLLLKVFKIKLSMPI